MAEPWNPVEEARKRYPALAEWDDARILNNLADPKKFRSAFPEYAELDDATIGRNISTLAGQLEQKKEALRLGVPQEVVEGQGIVERGVRGIGRGISTIAGMPYSIYQAATTEEQPGELMVPATPYETQGQAMSRRAASRMLLQPAIQMGQRTLQAGGEAYQMFRGQGERARERLRQGQPIAALQEAASPAPALKALEATGYGVATIMPGIGPYAAQLGERAGKGDVAGALTEAGTAFYAVPKTISKVPALYRGVREVGRFGVNPTRIRSVIPEAASLPDKAIIGTERVFRASAPTGGNPKFRSNLYAAAGDLAEVGRKAQLVEARGGVVSPDLRVRATVNALNEHLKAMYEGERLPQITRHGQAPLKLELGTDANEGLTYVSRRAGESSNRALAQKATDGVISLAEADKLARVVNTELRGFESMTPAERAASAATSRRLSSLKALDRSLSQVINGELARRGEVGISLYERRYAALSEIREQLQARMNAVELQRSSVAGRAARGLLGGKKAAIASASQAAVADVNIGRQLQLGLRELAESGITARRGVAGKPVPVRGLLPAPRTFLQPAGEPGGPSRVSGRPAPKIIVVRPKIGQAIQYLGEE